MASGDGKQLEALLGKSIPELGHSRSTGNVNPLCDRVQVLRNHGGRLVLWECKEVGTSGAKSKGDFFQLTDMTQNERNTMRDYSADGALCLILFMHQVDRYNVAFWCVTWEEWKAIEDSIGFVEEVVYTHGTTVKPRRKPGSCRVSMVAPGRPSCLRPVPVLANGRLDLSSFVGAWR